MHYSIERAHDVAPISWRNGQAWSSVAPVWKFTLDGDGVPRAVVITLPTLAHLRAIVRSARRRGIPRA
jgi:hypothetical protein